MRNARLFVMAVAVSLVASAPGDAGQVKTNVPAVEAGARPAIVERITIHGKALEGNLEADAAEPSRVFVGVFDADSVPDPDTLRWIAGEELAGRRALAYQGVTLSLANWSALGNLDHCSRLPGPTESSFNAFDAYLVSAPPWWTGNLPSAQCSSWVSGSWSACGNR